MSTSDALPCSGDAPEVSNVEQPGADTTDDVCTAAEALRRAKAELKKAQEVYSQVCRQAAEKVATVRKTTVGDILDGTLEQIKKHPGPGVFLAALAGFFLGRILRK